MILIHRFEERLGKAASRTTGTQTQTRTYNEGADSDPGASLRTKTATATIETADQDFVSDVSIFPRHDPDSDQQG